MMGEREEMLEFFNHRSESLFSLTDLSRSSSLFFTHKNVLFSKAFRYISNVCSLS